MTSNNRIYAQMGLPGVERGLPGVGLEGGQVKTAKLCTVVITDRPGTDCWAEFNRGWDALEYAKAAARQGYDADVWCDGVLEVSYPGETRRAEA